MSVSQIILSNGSPSQSFIASGTATLAANTPLTVAVAGLTASSVVVATFDSTANATGALRAVAGVNSFVLSSSSITDAGAVNWIAIR